MIKFSKSKSDILNIICISTVGLILVIVFSRFAVNPHPCGYFRYSFKPTRLALSHYYSYIAFLIGFTTFSCSIIDDLPWIPFIFGGLMILYTLIYQPYKDRPENLRSIFNLIVMCVFCGLRVYQQNVPKANFNAQPSYIYFTVCIILLLLVSIIGLLSNIFYFYYYNYKLPKLNVENDSHNL